MPILTVEAIRENPWNIVTHELPPQPSSLLLAAAYRAADYCRRSELTFMLAARKGDYMPDDWQPGPDAPDIHEESEERAYAADRKLEEIRQLIGKRHGYPVD